jgi:zinc protease
MSYTLRSLTDPACWPRPWHLASRQLGEPSFPDDIWQRERQRMSAVASAKPTPGRHHGGPRLPQAVYGGHPYGYDTTEATLARISRRTCAALPAAGAAVPGQGQHRRRRERAQADQIVTALLSRCPGPGPARRCRHARRWPALTAPKDERIPFAAAQAHVLIGQPGYKRNDPDYFPLLVGNYTLGGGGFVSRLTNEVREKRGLSYSVYSYFNARLHAGAFTVGLQTRPDQAEEAVRSRATC